MFCGERRNMDIRSYQAFDPTSAASVVVAQFSLALQNAMDRFLGYASDHFATSKDELLSSLRNQMNQLAGEDWTATTLEDLAPAIVGAILEVDPAAPEAEEQTDVLKTRLTSLQYLYRYAEAQVLVGLLGREKGIEAVKAYLDWTIEQRPLNTSGPDTISEMRERDIPWNLDDKGQDAISALVSESQCMKKVTACRTHEALKHLPDREVAEAVACYPDHASLRRSNPSFALTRTQTLIGGALYCDTCFHDTRCISAVRHPELPAFDGLAHEDA